MRRLALGQEELLEERCLWSARGRVKGAGHGPESGPRFFFCPRCVGRKGLRVRAWMGSEGSRHFFSLLLTFNTLTLFVCLESVCLSLPVPGHVLQPFPNVWLPLISVPGTPTSSFLFCPLVSACLHFPVPSPAPPLVSGLPVHPSPFVSPGPTEEEPSYLPRTEVKDILPSTPDPAL